MRELDGTSFDRRNEEMVAQTARSASAPAVARNISREEMKELLHLISTSKCIEIKVSVPMSDHQRTALSIGLDPAEAQPRHVYFFDTPDQALNRAGLIVRARRIQGGSADTVVKLRPVDPANIDAELKRSDDCKVEVDAMPDGTFVCSASYKGVATGQGVLDVTEGRKPLSSLFSKEQRSYFRAHAPAGINLDALSVHGPILLLRAKHKPKEYKRGITVELWLWRDGKHILEISTKCPPSEAFQAAVEFRTYLESHGVDLAAKQETKTRTAMDKFKADRKTRKGNGGIDKGMRQRA
jgi:hypothetical protein